MARTRKGSIAREVLRVGRTNLHLTLKRKKVRGRRGRQGREKREGYNIHTYTTTILKNVIKCDTPLPPYGTSLSYLTQKGSIRRQKPHSLMYRGSQASPVVVASMGLMGGYRPTGRPYTAL